VTARAAPEASGEQEVPPPRLDDLTALLLGDRAIVELLDTVMEVGAGALPSVRGVSISMVRDGDPGFETTNASSARIRRLDESQYTVSSGPCIEAIRSHSEVRATIPAPAWPEFSTAAEGVSVRAVWSMPLWVEQRVAGAINLYWNGDSPWDGPAAEPARLLARQATAVLGRGAALARSEHANVTLRRALETRTVIGQAQGVLMARQQISPDEAFDILRRASQRTNRKLRDVAAEIVAAVSHSDTPHP
jgi:hypothetical protein